MTTEALIPQPEIADIESIMVEVLSAIGVEAYPGGDGVAPCPETLNGAVSVTGAWEGHVAMRFNAETARSLAATMLGIDDVADVEDPDVDDAVGELANMVGGNIKALMPDPSVLTLPRLFSGGEDERYPLASRTVEAHALTPHGPISVAVWQRSA